MAARAGTAFIEFQGDFSRIDAQLRELGHHLQSVGSSAGKNLTRGLGSESTRSFRQVGQSADRASRQLNTFRSVNERLGTTLRSAAKYAVGAGVAYLSISQAKSAITTTEDLAKSTLSLTKNLGLGTKTASEFAAVAKVRGADTRQLGMAFTTLSRQVVSARQGTQTAVKSFNSLGISARELKKASPEDMLFRVSDGLKQLGPGFARAKIQQQLFGRGAQTIVPVLRDGSDALRSQLQDAGELGAVFSKLGLKDMQDVIAAQRRMQLAGLGLQIAFTQAMAPAITAATDQLANFGKILNDPTLSGDQKFHKISAVIIEDFAKVTPAVVKIAEGWTVEIARGFAQNAPHIAGAFVDGFIHAPIWGQVAIGALVFKELGAGHGGAGALGKEAGRKWALGFLGAALTLQLGRTLADAWNGEMLDQTKSEALSQQLGKTLGDAAKFISIGRRGLIVGTAVGRLIFNPETGRVIDASTKKLKHLIGQNADQVNFALSNMFGKHGHSGGQDVAGDWGQGLSKLEALTKSHLGRVINFTKTDIAIIRGEVSQGMDWRVLVKTRFDAIVNQIKQSMKSGKISVRQGTAEINQILSEELNVLGSNISVGQIRKYRGQQKAGKIPDLIQPGNHQRGAVMVPGAGSGDKVPAALEANGVVWNRNVVPALLEPREIYWPPEEVNRMGGPRFMDSFNQRFPRFAKGGTIPTFTPGGPGAVSAISAGALNVESKAASKVLADAIAKAAAASGPNAPGGPSGTSTWKGVLMATWVKQALEYAARKGVAPQPTSGYRSHATNVAAGRGGYHSEHEYTHYPHGAVDFGGMVDPPSLPKKMSVVHATRNFRFPLLAPIGFRDDGHASGTGHQRGGIVRLAGGGRVPRPKHGAHWAHVLAAGSPAGRRVTVDEGATLLWQAGLSESQAGELSRVIPNESGGNAAADNPTSTAQGLFQILGAVFPGNLNDPRISAINAAMKYRDAGNSLSPWTGAPSGPAGRILREMVQSTRRGKHGKKLKAPKTGASNPLPLDMQQRIASLTTTTDAFGEYADRAGQIAGPVLGRTEVAWLQAELQGLFDLRNLLMRAFNWLAAAREQVAKQISTLRGRLSGSKGKGRKAIQDQLKTLKDRMSAIQSTTGDTTSSLQDVQGTNVGGYASKVLQNLPAAGTLGGKIFDVQVALKDAGATAAASAAGSALTPAALKEIGYLRDLGVKFYPSQFADLPFAGAFLEGGVVPGPVGSPQAAIVHGGETITPVDGDPAGLPFVVLIEDGAVDHRRIRAISGEEAQRKLDQHNRSLLQADLAGAGR